MRQWLEEGCPKQVLGACTQFQKRWRPGLVGGWTQEALPHNRRLASTGSNRAINSPTLHRHSAVRPLANRCVRLRWEVTESRGTHCGVDKRRGHASSRCT